MSMDERGKSLIGAITIEWESQYKEGAIMWKVPRNIRLNDNIVVREDEYAVFYRDGKALTYIDRPDRYALTSINAPVVGPLVKLLSGVVQSAEVFYLQKRPVDGKFGSRQPYQFRDEDFGMVNLRLFGDYRWRIKDCNLFINQFVGTLNDHRTEEVENRMREQMVLLVYDALGNLKERGMGVAELAANLTTIEQLVIQKSREHFEPYGVEIQKLMGLYISMPEEVQKAVDAKASMTILGTDYMGYQTGQAMREAASSPSGDGSNLAGAGVGFGAGMGMGMTMMDTMARRGAPTREPGVHGSTSRCVKCGAPIPPQVKFCPECGGAQVGGEPCIKCGKTIDPDAKFCPLCGAAQENSCPGCGAKVDGDASFCHKCGARLDGEAEEGRKCPKCGRETWKKAGFCPHCGHQME